MTNPCISSTNRKRQRYDSGEDLIDPSEMFGSSMGGMADMFGGGMGGGVRLDPEFLFNMMGGTGPGGHGGAHGGPGGFSFSTSTGAGGAGGGGGGNPFGRTRNSRGFSSGFSF